MHKTVLLTHTYLVVGNHGLPGVLKKVVVEVPPSADWKDEVVTVVE